MTTIATFWKDSNYTGSSISLTTSLLAIPDLSAYGLGDELSSLKCIDRNYFITIYQNPNYSGNSWRFRAPMWAANLSDYGFNDKISSIRADFTTESIQGNVVLYQHSNCTGKGYYVAGPTSVSNVTSLGIPNDWVSSIMLYPNTTARLYVDINYGGNVDPFVNFDSSLITQWNVTDNDTTSSFTLSYTS